MATYAGPDQETTQVDDTMQLLLACLCIPADPLVSILELQGGCAEPQATEPAMFRADQVANLRTDQRTGATRPPRLLGRAKKRNIIIVCSGIGIQAPRFLGDAELDEIIPQPT